MLPSVHDKQLTDLRLRNSGFSLLHVTWCSSIVPLIVLTAEVSYCKSMVFMSSSCTMYSCVAESAVWSADNSISAFVISSPRAISLSAFRFNDPPTPSAAPFPCPLSLKFHVADLKFPNVCNYVKMPKLRRFLYCVVGPSDQMCSVSTYGHVS